MFILKIADKTHPVTKDIIKIGRHTSNDIVLGETRVSRFHSEIVTINGRLFLLDKKTINGTFINDKRILPDREISLKPEDNVGIGCPAGELAACTIKIDHSSDETPPNEDNEVVSTTNDSDSDQNLLNGPDDDEFHDADKSCEASSKQLRFPSTEFPASAQREAEELKKRSLPSTSTACERADCGQSSSRQLETPFPPQVKSEPLLSSPEKSKKISNLPSSRTTDTRVKQPPADDNNAPVSPVPNVADVKRVPFSPDTLAKDPAIKKYFGDLMKEFLNEKLAEGSILPSLLHLSNTSDASPSGSSTSQTSSSSTNVKQENSVKASSQPSSLASGAGEKKRVKSDLKVSTVTSVDAAKTECLKVDLCEELENDVEITDVPTVAPTAIKEAASRVPRRASARDVDESTRKQSPPPEPEAKRSREGQTNRPSSTEAVINLCDANEGAEDVIEISDEENGGRPRRRLRNRKHVDPNTIVIEDTRDDEEGSRNVASFFSKPVVSTAPRPVELAESCKLKVVCSEQSESTCKLKVELPQPTLITPVDPSHQSEVKLRQPSVTASAEHLVNKRLKIDLVEDPPSNEPQVRFAGATVTTPVELPRSERRQVSFQEPISPSENLSTDEPMFRFSEPKGEPINRPITGLQESTSSFPPELSEVEREGSQSLFSDVPSTSSVIDLCADKEPPVRVKSEPVVHSNYSNFDEIIALDSDDEDFPQSQLNTTQINDVPDFSYTFEKLFDENECFKEDPHMLECNENTWFEPFSQTKMVEGKYVARSLESDEVMTEKELQSILDEEPDGVAENSEEEEAGDKMEVDEEPSSSKPSVEDDIPDFGEVQQPQSSEWLSVEKKKYQLRGCNVVLTDALPLMNRQWRKAQKEAEKERRRLSSSCEETSPKLNDESVFRDVTAKKRPAEPSVLKVKKRKRRNRSPTMSVQEKKLIKEMRKEKLKEITPKPSETKVKDIFRLDAKPVVKVTDKNRGSFLMDTMIKDVALPKRPAKVELSTKEPLLRKRDKPSTSEPGSSKLRTHSKEEASRLPVLKEKVANANDLKSNDAKPMEPTSDQRCKIDQRPGPSRSGICEPQDDAFANALNAVTYQKKKEQKARKNDVKVAKKNTNSTATNWIAPCVDAGSPKKMKFSNALYRPRKTKSCLKKAPAIYAPINIYDPPKPKKKVRFNRLTDRQIIPWDALERRNNGIFAPAYKLNENLIREAAGEFETAMAKVCSWNVKWLEEQQKFHEPPPLYPEKSQLSVNSTPTVKYKEELKCDMFTSLWHAIFRTWNKPDNDFLPHTQFINEKTSLSTLMLESVDTTKGEKNMWSIVASRTVPANETDSDLSNGQVVILNFPIVTRAASGAPRKTMVFGYVGGFNKTVTPDKESVIQRMVFRISPKPFNIVLGEAKLKALSYLKSHLRPFQALAMITKSPLTGLIVDPNKKFFYDQAFDPTGDWFHDKFLDPSQRRAVASCLNCILSPEPSLCVVDGAPGTGKSQVIVSLMRELFSKNNRNRFPNDLRILIVTHQDVLADDLSFRIEGLNKKEKCFNFLRYGNCRGMHAAMKNCTLDKKIQDLLNEDQGNKLINLDEEKNNLRAQIHSIKLVLESTSAKPEKLNEAKIKLTNNERDWNDMERENSRVIEQLKSQVAKEMSIESADVILTSSYSCWSSNFEQDFVPNHRNKGDIHKFTVCIFDDASLLSEMAMLIPLMLMVRSLILVGDHRNEITINKSKSPFSRLLNDCVRKAPSAVTALNVQYRMPLHITQWVDEFYNIKCKPRNPSPHPGLKIKSFFAFDISLPPMDDINYRYEIQANYCCLLVEKLNQLVEDPSVRFGIIVAQSSQKDIIKSTRGLFERGRKVIVETLDEFSGREHEVVILCLPYQCNPYASWLYVAVTRAKGSLFVCGDFAQLKDQECVCSLVKFAKSRNLYSLRDPHETDIPNSLISWPS